jgi:hypothetical protein
MSRVKILSPTASFLEISRSQGLKMTLSLPLAKIYTSFFRAEMFFATARIKFGCGNFFLRKISFLEFRRSKILKALSKTVFFWFENWLSLNTEKDAFLSYAYGDSLVLKVCSLDGRH